MHHNLNTKYYFINNFDTKNIDKIDKQTVVIFRNYDLKKIDKTNLLKILCHSGLTNAFIGLAYQEQSSGFSSRICNFMHKGLNEIDLAYNIYINMKNYEKIDNNNNNKNEEQYLQIFNNLRKLRGDLLILATYCTPLDINSYNYTSILESGSSSFESYSLESE